MGKPAIRRLLDTVKRKKGKKGILEKVRFSDQDYVYCILKRVFFVSFLCMLKKKSRFDVVFFKTISSTLSLVISNFTDCQKY